MSEDEVAKRREEKRREEALRKQLKREASRIKVKPGLAKIRAKIKKKKGK